MKDQTQEDCIPTPLPSKWYDCDPMGDEIYRLIPSKIPVGQHLEIEPSHKKYTLEKAFSMKEDIYLVVDLTSTSISYDISCLKNEGRYLKVDSCSGGDIVPTNKDVNIFLYMVKSFLKSDKKKKCLIHSTFGYNRTGYMIVHYLVRLCMFPVTQALEMFGNARSPGIRNDKYISALYSFYHINRPIWPFDQNAHEDDDSSFQPISTCDNGAEGDEIYVEEASFIRSFVLKQLALKDVSSFLMSPQSLAREDLPLLEKALYLVRWKVRGDRFWLLLTHTGCFLISIDFKIRRVQMRFPNLVFEDETKNPWCSASTLLHNVTLLDGQMITETATDLFPGSKYIYVIDDVILLNSSSVVKRPFLERYSLILDFIIQPRNCEINEWQISCIKNPGVCCYYKYAMEPFMVRRRELWPLPMMVNAFTPLLPNLFHEVNGLVFQACSDKYDVNPHRGLLEWRCEADGITEEEITNIIEDKGYSSELKRMNTEIKNKKSVEDSMML